MPTIYHHPILLDAHCAVLFDHTHHLAFQVVSGRKKAPPTGWGRTASVGVAGMYGIPEESLEEWEGPVVGGVVRGEGPVVGGVARGEGLAGEIGAVVSGLGQFKTELLQLHAIVSSLSLSLCA